MVARWVSVSICVAVLSVLLVLALNTLLPDRADGIFPVTTLLKRDNFTEADIEALGLEGKVVIVTGASAGIGKATTEYLVDRGATVIMGCRSMEKCEKARPKNKSKGEAICMHLELSKLASVAKFAKEFREKYDVLDSLILNAGYLPVVLEVTEDGIEQSFQVNHVSHQLLAELLLDRIESSHGPATIVALSSGAHWNPIENPEGIYFSLEHLNNPINFSEREYYGQGKLANALFTRELQRQLDARGSKIVVNCVHPGGVYSEFFSSIKERAEAAQNTARAKVVDYMITLAPYLFWTNEKAAMSVLKVALKPDGIRGSYVIPVARVGQYSPKALNDDTARRLWEFTKTLYKDHI